MEADLIESREMSEIVAMAEQVRGLCSVITKVARADLQSQLKRHGSSISAIEHGVLRHLSRGVRYMSEMSRLMGVAPSTLVYVVDGLVQKKLVKRGRDPKDRRREPLRLEEKGAELYARFSKMDAGSTLVKSLTSMVPRGRRELLGLLHQLVKELTGSERLYLDAVTAKSVPASAPGVQKAKRREAKL